MKQCPIQIFSLQQQQQKEFRQQQMYMEKDCLIYQSGSVEGYFTVTLKK